MILYTPLPQEVIFGAQGSEAGSEAVPVLRQITYEDKDMLVSDLPNANGCKIERLLSTEPADFMDPRYQPGTVIKAY